jgi:hypothetical protein
MHLQPVMQTVLDPNVKNNVSQQQSQAFLTHLLFFLDDLIHN